MLLALGYRQEARILARRAVGSDPLVSIYRNTLGNTMAFGGASPDVPDPSAEALRQYAKVRETGPDMVYGYMNAYRTLLKDGLFDEAEAMFQMEVDRGLVPPEAMADVKSALSAARLGEAGAPALRAMFAANPNTQGTITIVLKDPDLTIALMQPVWDEAYQSAPVLVLLRPAGVYQHPTWKAEVRKQGVLALWKSRGFPDWCKPVGADDFACDSGE